MARLRLSKSSLQQQRDQLKLYQRLLPSLDLKRRQLTVELTTARRARTRAREAVDALDTRIGGELPMLAGHTADLSGLVRVAEHRVSEENVVGVRLPRLDGLEFRVADYPRLARAPWIDALVDRLQEAATARVAARVAARRVEILEVAVRRMTQRVNLFDKILIPEARRNIQRILIYLGDQERAAVSTAKLTKRLQAKRRARGPAEVVTS